jgi:P-loop containing NTP hydrolase pore-1
LGRDLDGVIVFDESHAMQNAAREKSERGEGRAGLRLQHALPNARVLHVSATGATSVHNLAYVQRLGLCGGADFPFATRAEFVEAIEAGGVAAMEVLARDLKTLGRYAARSLSFDGIEYELIEHQLTSEQIRTYDAYAAAFQVIHNNLNAALAFAAVLDGRPVLQLQHGLELRRVRVMGESRVELSGFTDGMVDRLKAMGLISEIISWKLRLLEPTGSSGPTILAKLMEGHPPVRVADKAAA